VVRLSDSVKRKVMWPELKMPPINLWSLPLMNVDLEGDVDSTDKHRHSVKDAAIP